MIYDQKEPLFDSTNKSYTAAHFKSAQNVI